MYLVCLFATLLASVQDPPHEPTMVERIEALIAKSNSYEGFVVRYQLRDGDGHEYSLRIGIGQRLIDKTATTLRDWLGQLDVSDPQTQSEASEWVRKARENMETDLKTLAGEVDPEPAFKCSCKLRPSLYEDLATIEKRIQPELFSEGIIKPLLAAFEEKVAKQVGAK